MFWLELFATIGTILGYYCIANKNPIGFIFNIIACIGWLFWGVILGSTMPFLILQGSLITISTRGIIHEVKRKAEIKPISQ